MFSALKKLVGSEPGQLKEKNIPAGLQSMNQSLQRRFAKGVQYNMKIVIRGDRNTGKSTLWHRLQGKKFVEEYIPTQEIQATSIHWNYKTTDDVVKVEVWDVVDKGQKYPLPEGVGKGKRRGDNLKLENEPQESDEVALDAEFLDVYKNCNGVIMMFDITKQWTFNYILRELPKVPTHVPVCVLGNYRDMGEHRVILPDDIRDLIAGLNRPMGSSYIHYAESSMKNGFGLKYLHKFFNIPFLQLQRETLLRQLETNQLDMDATLEELCVQQETEDQNYEIFLENLESRSKGYGSPGPANGQSPSSGSQSPIVPPSGASTGSSSPSTPQPPIPSQPLPQSPSVSTTSPPPPTAAAGGAASPAAEVKSLAQSPEHLQSPAAGASGPQKRSFISRWFGSSPATEASASAPEEPPVLVCPAKVQSVDDFVPDERLDKSFLEDSLPSKTKVPQPAAAPTVDSDSDGEDRGNPMVSSFQDELDPDDTEPSLSNSKALPPIKDITLSSDEEEGIPTALVISQDQDLESKPELKAPMITKPKVTSKAPDPQGQTTPPISLTLTPAAEQPARHQGKKKGSTPKVEDSDTDPEAPVAQQMLSFVMDDPDFDSEASDTPKIAKDTFPVRDELLSDLSDDDMQLAKVPEPLKPTVITFKPKDDTDLFGLGIQEEPPAAKESSEDQEEKESKHSSKEKKKKKKKSKEEDEKSKKKHKHKKREKDEAAVPDEKEKKKKKSRTKKTEVDELEDFLGGGAASIKRDDGDYEEL
ncbi:rab-like protein 6 isoform X1 [Simochromis diagramma]|uniref:rab-like protein 6 isoform X1 n=1 Tax=Simochromis diagramma TaxID=43689 RepID=UPI001A7EE102|nr:rab-like protein 6 isoform X1 [Simochromis diagramma]XP_039905985.1 rab-like protein 6 isoform X1 [Simochromis diagramma]XP_039905986.1 rab-like protein 6 isoform X1 [Simochromis diagramma]XP_039905987.1 rab-like protein 6 isoform X1 [Simochromis diagramma]